MSVPPYQPPTPPTPGAGNTLLCRKCAGVMKTYERNGVHPAQRQGYGYSGGIRDSEALRERSGLRAFPVQFVDDVAVEDDVCTGPGLHGSTLGDVSAAAVNSARLR